MCVCTFIGAHSHVSLHGWLSTAAVLETCFFAADLRRSCCDHPSHGLTVWSGAHALTCVCVCVSVCSVTTSHLCPPYLCQYTDWIGPSKPASSSSSAEARQEAPPPSWTGFLLQHQTPRRPPHPTLSPRPLVILPDDGIEMIVEKNRFDETFNYRLHWMWVVAGVVS